MFCVGRRLNARKSLRMPSAAEREGSVRLSWQQACERGAELPRRLVSQRALRTGCR